MTLELKAVAKRVGSETLIHPTDLSFGPGSFNVLLGTTLSGKTTLMQMMAGIQKPSSGAVFFKGRDVTDVPVQKRNVSFVYQQFINYPNLSVYENIASPLRVAGYDRAEIDSRVNTAAELLRLKPMLQRKPSELSGGQQQRTAIARAVVKDSDIIFLDEPLANLDYKLREELRGELPKLFAGRNAIVVYATTEPSEALLFGGSTATLHEGRMTHFGPTSTIYRTPKDLTTAQVFSDPPINTVRAEKHGCHFLFNDRKLNIPQAAKLPDGTYILGFRPHHISLVESSADFIEGDVLVTEISGSESVIHLNVKGQTWISQSSGVHQIRIGDSTRAYLDLARVMIFGVNGEFLL